MKKFAPGAIAFAAQRSLAHPRSGRPVDRRQLRRRELANAQKEAYLPSSFEKIDWNQGHGVSNTRASRPRSRPWSKRGR